MSLTFAGSAAAFLTLSGNTLTYSSDPSTITAGSYTYTITETLAGYDNSPHSSSGTIVVASVGSSPIARTIVPVPDRTFVLKRVAPQSQTTLNSYYAAFAGQPFDPSDKSPWYVDLTGMLADGETLGAIVSLSPSPSAAAIGVSIDDGARRCAYDVTNGIIEFRLKCNTLNTAAFSGNGSQVGIDLTFSVNSTDNLTDQYHKTLGINARIA